MIACKIKNIEEIKKILLTIQNNNIKTIAWNIKESINDYNKGKIVGISLCLSEEEGYYIPINHYKENNNIELKECLNIFYDIISNVKLNILYDVRKNLRWLELNGLECNKIKTFDIILSSYIVDVNNKEYNFKYIANKFCNNIELEKDYLSHSKVDFYRLSSDVIYNDLIYNTSLLFTIYKNTLKYHKRSGYSSSFDQSILYPLMKYENSQININLINFKKEFYYLENNLKELKNRIYDYAGENFNINSIPQLTKLFYKLGIKEKNKKNKIISFALDELETLKDKIVYHPIIDDLILYRKMEKEFTAYIKPIVAYNKDKLRFQYKLTSTPTGRIVSAGTSNSFFAPLNIQSVPKPKNKNYYYRKATNTEIQNKRDFLGYIISEKDDGNSTMIEGYDQNNNLRKNFLPNDDDSVWCSFDMKQEELRIMANMFKEPLWIKAFNENKDLYKEMAINMFGENNYNEDLRKCAKVCFSDEHRFLTNKGYIKGRDLVSSLEYNVLDLNKKEQENIAYIQEEVEGIRLTLDNGMFIDVTKDHKFPVLQNEQLVWKKAEDLDHFKDLLLFNQENYIPVKKEITYKNVEITEDLAWFLGFIQLNISKIPIQNLIAPNEKKSTEEEKEEYNNKLKTLSLLKRKNYNSNKDDIDYLYYIYYPSTKKNRIFYNILTDDFRKQYPIYNNFYTYTKKSFFTKYNNVDINKDSTHIGILNNIILDLFDSYDDLNTRIPNFIFQSPKNIMEAYIAGVIDSRKTTFYKERKELLFQIEFNENFTNDFALLLNICGYNLHSCSYIKHKQRKSTINNILPFAIKSSLFISNYKTNKHIKFNDKLKELYYYTYGEYLSLVFDKYIFFNQQKLCVNEITPLIEKVIGSIHCNQEELNIIYSNELFKKYKPVYINLIEKKNIKLKPLVLQTSTHMYSAMCVNSHNCSFGILYGMGANTLNKHVPSMTKTECYNFIDTFKSKLPILFSEQQKLIESAKKTGYVSSYFGRLRNVSYWLSSPDSSIYNNGERIVVNTPIQGTASDILKGILIKLYRNIFSNTKYKDKISFLFMIHDEINFSIKKDYINEIVPKIFDIMNVSIKDWPVPLQCKLSIGPNWGNLYDLTVFNTNILK